MTKHILIDTFQRTMKAPAGIESITLAEKEIGCGGAYPPHGFKPFWEAGLGNGDYFGQ